MKASQWNDYSLLNQDFHCRVVGFLLPILFILIEDILFRFFFCIRITNSILNETSDSIHQTAVSDYFSGRCTVSASEKMDFLCLSKYTYLDGYFLQSYFCESDSVFGLKTFRTTLVFRKECQR